MLGTKTIAALKRGLEIAAGAFVGFIAIQFYQLDAHTATGFVDVVKTEWDPAAGSAILALILGFGYTRSRLPNLSPVAENADV